MTKTSAGNFFEDFRVGDVIRHATPRTVTEGDVALYNGLYGPRFAVQSSDAFAKAIGYPRAPVDDLLVFHTVFGKSVPDISLNAIANLGYAECRFLEPVYPGDSLSAASEVIGLRENANRASGVVYVRTTGRNQNGEPVLEYVRWVMVRKRETQSPAPAPVVPKLAERVDPAALGKAFAERGIDAKKVKIIGTGEVVDEASLKGMGDAGLGIISVWHYDYNDPTKLNAEFVKAYNAEFKRNPDFGAVGGYDGMHVIYEALKKTGGKADAEGLVAAAKGLKWESPRGPMQIDAETRDIVQNISIRRVEKVGNELRNVVIDKVENVKDPGSAGKK